MGRPGGAWGRGPAHRLKDRPTRVAGRPASVSRSSQSHWAAGGTEGRFQLTSRRDFKTRASHPCALSGKFLILVLRLARAVAMGSATDHGPKLLPEIEHFPSRLGDPARDGVEQFPVMPLALVLVPLELPAQALDFTLEFLDGLHDPGRLTLVPQIGHAQGCFTRSRLDSRRPFCIDWHHVPCSRPARRPSHRPRSWRVAGRLSGSRWHRLRWPAGEEDRVRAAQPRCRPAHNRLAGDATHGDPREDRHLPAATLQRRRCLGQSGAGL